MYYQHKTSKKILSYKEYEALSAYEKAYYDPKVGSADNAEARRKKSSDPDYNILLGGSILSDSFDIPSSASPSSPDFEPGGGDFGGGGASDSWSDSSSDSGSSDSGGGDSGGGD